MIEFSNEYKPPHFRKDNIFILPKLPIYNRPAKTAPPSETRRINGLRSKNAEEALLFVVELVETAVKPVPVTNGVVSAVASATLIPKEVPVIVLPPLVVVKVVVAVVLAVQPFVQDVQGALVAHGPYDNISFNLKWDIFQKSNSRKS